MVLSIFRFANYSFYFEKDNDFESTSKIASLKNQ